MVSALRARVDFRNVYEDLINLPPCHGLYFQINALQSRVIALSTGLALLCPFKINEDQSIKVKETDLTILLKTADNLFENGQHEECYSLLTSHKVTDDVELSWRICRVLYTMSRESKDKIYTKELILKAYKIISKELRDHYEHFAVQQWYAIILEAKSSHEGTKERIKQLENIKKHMDIAVQLNPNEAITLHMLGEWCYQISGLPWYQRKIAETFFGTPPHSTYEEALEYFLSAETAQPRFRSINLLRIGVCYLKLNNLDKAKHYLKLAASFPAKSDDDHLANKEATELLNKIK